MEAFCLLAKHLRGGCAEGGGSANTIITAAVSPYSSDGEDGPYFDLEFSLPQDEEPTKRSAQEDGGHGSSYADHEMDAKLINSTVTDQENVTTSDELLFNGELVPIESSSHVLQHEHDSDQNCKFPVSVLKSAAAKFGLVLLKLKKSSPERTEDIPKTEGNRKFFAFRIFQSQNAENSEFQDQDRKSKQQYLKMVKPAVKGKDGSSGHAKTSPMQMQGLLSGESPSAPANKTACKRRDDSLLQEQDGIQGAILHCKRSFNASIDIH